ncbi:AEC family transporter [soil metagenome]
MQAILSVTIPFFALVLLGYLAAQWRLLPESAIPGLNAYVLYFALPCMLFRFGASMPFAQLIDPALIGIYALCALAMVALTVSVTLRRRPGGHGVNLTDAAFGALVAAFPNSGFMGVPLLAALFGAQAAGPVIGTLLVDLFLTSTLCLAIAQAHRHRGQARQRTRTGVGGIEGIDRDAQSLAAASDGRAGDPSSSVLFTVARALRGALGNPQPWAIGLGAVAAATSLQLPAPVAQVVKMLADSASPVALFTIGAVLWRARQHAHTRTATRDYLPVALLKLFAHPLLVGATGLAARAAGIAVPNFGLMMLVLAAALPSASNVSLLAERYGADNGRVARIIMASTVLAFGSFTLIAWGFEQMPR